MKLYMPTKVYNEKGCVRQHSQELAALGTKALLVTGKHSSRVNGSLQDVKDALNREQVPYVVFDGIEENPSVETVMRATALGLSEKVDFVIGIGGGSPMDASKAIALMIANPEKKADFLYETDAAVKQAANKALTSRGSTDDSRNRLRGYTVCDFDENRDAENRTDHSGCF